MKNPIPPISYKTFKERVTKWLSPINHGESVSIVNINAGEQAYRINQLLLDEELIRKNLKEYKTTQIIPIDFTTLPIEDPEELHLYLDPKLDKSKKTFVLMILNADKLILERMPILSYLNSIPTTKPSFSLIFFFYKNIAYPHFLRLLSPLSILYQNVIYHPYYNQRDVTQYLSYIESKFNVSLKKRLKEKIIKQCGGHFWLVKEAVRYFIKTKEEEKIFDHDEMILKLKIIFDGFEDMEKKVLEKIAIHDFNFNEEDKIVLDYFLKIKLVAKDKKKYNLNIPLLGEYIRKQIPKKIRIRIDNNRIIINDIIADSIFSKRERKLLKFLFFNQKKPISREDVASAIWEKDYQDAYTDWALDQVVRRFRNKLSKLGVSRDILKTNKNRGFVFDCQS